MRRLLVLGIMAAAVVSMAAAPAQMASRPLKPGLWQIDVRQSAPAGGYRMTVCADATTRSDKYLLPGSNEGCQTVVHAATADRDDLTMTCAIDKTSQMVSRMTVTYAGDTAFKATNTITQTSPKGSQPMGTLTMDGKWLGACPAGMKTGATGAKVEPLPNP